MRGFEGQKFLMLESQRASSNQLMEVQSTASCCPLTWFPGWAIVAAEVGQLWASLYESQPTK